MTALRLPDGTICRTGPSCRLHGDLHTLQEQVYASYMDGAKKSDDAFNNDLANKTPVDIDTRLYKLYEEKMKEVNLIIGHHSALERLHKRIEKAKSGDSRIPRYEKSWAEYDSQKEVDYHENEIQAAQEREAEVDKKTAVLDDEFQRRGGWTRAFFVANAGGHVHKSMKCSTCYPTTRFQWLPQYSGRDENEIVSDAGDRACTICYSSAPVEYFRQPSKINDPEKEAARKEREEKKAAKETAAAVKAIANPDGTPLIMNGWKQKTVRSAEIEAVSMMVDVEVDKTRPEFFRNRDYLEEKKRDTERALVALAHKYGTSVEDERARLMKKAKPKVKKWLKEADEWDAKHGKQNDTQ